MALLASSPPFLQTLACAAISRELRSVLVFDASASQLRALTGLLAAMLQDVTGKEPHRVTLGSADGEDVLWGTYAPSSGKERSLFWEPGLLAPHGSTVSMVLLPDLPRLGLAAARACVSLMGAESAHLERNGQHRQWRPNLCWVAGCARSELGQVSPHLLDRFALRLDGSILFSQNRLKALRKFLQGRKAVEDGRKLLAEYGLEPGALRSAARRRASATTKALEAVVDLFARRGERQSARRELTLARLALALARLDAAPEASVHHVEGAGALLGLDRPETQAKPELELSGSTPRPRSEESPAREEGMARQGALTSSHTTPLTPPAPVTAEGPVLTPASPIAAREPLALVLAAPPAAPYPEDGASKQREPDALRFPVQRSALGAVPHGAIIGVRQATDLNDLAITRTLFEAAKFQAFRRKKRRGHKGLILSVSDLRSHWRAAPQDELLVLLLDHTALRGWKNWGAAVLPHLRDAYVRRATVGVIQVGAANAPAGTELRARQVVGRSILARQVNLALAAEPGRATPLAHGLDLAFELIQHSLQHGRDRTSHARLVVVTDGRGNVPLESSREGRVTGPVGDVGIRDALEVAHRLRKLDPARVKSVLIHPSPRQYPELPGKLATALGASLYALKKERP